MQLNKNLISYLDKSNINETINSNFLITDLEKIIYTSTDERNNDYLLKTLNSDLISLIEKWNCLEMSEKIIFVENNPTISIINNDTHNYSAIMIFPIYIDAKIEGLAIYFRNYGNYINSSQKAPNTIRKWIMKFLESSI